MILHIDTTPDNLVEIGVIDKNKFIVKKKFSSQRTQAEKLLPAITKLLKAGRIKLSDLQSIEVANRGGSFTSLRIGVITANALGYGLGIPVAGELGRAKRVSRSKQGFNVVEPLYSGAPDITKPRPNK